MKNTEYSELVDKKSPRSPLLKNICFAFLFGGIICTIGQAINYIFVNMGLKEDMASAATSITLIFIGALLTGLNLYDNISKYAGAGTLVPITGFANAVTSPAMEFKTEGIVLGLSAKMFIIAGPVLVFGIGSSVIYGIIQYIINMV